MTKLEELSQLYRELECLWGENHILDDDTVDFYLNNEDAQRIQDRIEELENQIK